MRASDPDTQRLHTPVLCTELLELFTRVPSPHTFLDGTFGRGGHTELLLTHFPESRVVALDRDPEAISFARQVIAPLYAHRFTVHQGRFGQAKHLFPLEEAFSGIILDLGVSSPQLDTAHRGFSFLHEGPLDMRMDTTTGITAENLLASATEKELADIFYYYGEERHSRRLSRLIVDARQRQPLRTTTQLATLVERAVGRGSSRLHPATKIFQALRIAVNDELEDLWATLPHMTALLKPGGCFAVITFHSLEDRLVKNFFRRGMGMQNPPEEPPLFHSISKKPVIPTAAEMKSNPRARSAKMRWAFTHPRG